MSAILADPLGVSHLTGETAASAATFKLVDAEYVASAAISAGQPVVFSSTATVAKTATGSNRTLVLGIASTTAAAGEIVHVVHHGVVKLVPCESGVAAGDPVTRSGSTAGTVDTAAAPGAGVATGILGVALSAAASGTCTVFVSPSFARATG